MQEMQSLQEAFLHSLRRLRSYKRNDAYQQFSRAEYDALEALFHLQELSDGNPVRVSALAAKLQLSPQAMSKALRILEQKAYVQRHTDPRDRRNTLVCLTQQGETLLTQVRSGVERFYAEVISRMGEEQVRVWIQLSEKFADILQEVRNEFQIHEKEDAHLG